jgi:hypothetical protein
VEERRMSDMSLQLVLRDPVQGHAALSSHGWPWAKAQMTAGRPVVAEFRLLEDDKTNEQRGYLHIIYTFIAEHAVVNGQKFPMKVWKEYYRDKFLGFKVKSFKDPMTGRTVRRRVRVSTEDLGVKGYAILIDKVTAHASTDLNLTVPPPVRRGEIDPDTGEIRGMR